MKVQRHSLQILPALIILFISLAACKPTVSIPPTETSMPPSATPEPPTSTPLPPTATETPTETPTPIPTDTPTATQTLTGTPTETPTQTPVSNASYIPDNIILVYLTHLGTGGPIGCGDSLMPIRAGYLRTGNIEEDIATALNTLFSMGHYWGELYNATYPSSLRVVSVDLNKTTEVVDIVLQGSYVKPDNKCDKLRYREQVWATVRQFPGIKQASIWLTSGVLLGDLLYAP